MKKIRMISLVLLGMAMGLGCSGERDLDCEYFDDCEDGTGQISVTVQGSTYLGAVEIYFDGEYQGVTTGYYASTPPCEASGSLTVSVPVGSYQVTGEWGGNPLSTYANVNVKENTCHIVQLSL